MDKSNLKWVLYTGEMFDVYVTPHQIQRILAPLEPDLEYVTEMQCRCLRLRPCAEGLNKDGYFEGYLYSTNSGRFFRHGKRGWAEHKYDYSPAMRNYKKGSTHPMMRQFGHLLCHLLVAHAWLGPRPEGKVCDHKDTNLMNWRASNLEWVWPAENYRRAGIARQLRRYGIDPKRLDTNLLDGIFKLSDEHIGTLTGRFLWLSHTEFGDVELDIRSLNACVAAALDHTIKISQII